MQTHPCEMISERHCPVFWTSEVASSTLKLQCWKAGVGEGSSPLSFLANQKQNIHPKCCNCSQMEEKRLKILVWVPSSVLPTPILHFWRCVLERITLVKVLNLLNTTEVPNSQRFPQETGGWCPEGHFTGHWGSCVSAGWWSQSPGDTIQCLTETDLTFSSQRPSLLESRRFSWPSLCSSQHRSSSGGKGLKPKAYCSWQEGTTGSSTSTAAGPPRQQSQSKAGGGPKTLASGFGMAVVRNFPQGSGSCFSCPCGWAAQLCWEQPVAPTSLLQKGPSCTSTCILDPSVCPLVHVVSVVGRKAAPWKGIWQGYFPSLPRLVSKFFSKMVSPRLTGPGD